MKKTKKNLFPLAAAVILSILLCIPTGSAFFYYLNPMEDVSYNLSILSEDGQEWGGTKGWTVYTNDNNVSVPLQPDGFGGYNGLAYPGQTFYFSRKLTEKLDSPSLRLGAANRTLAVFLDENLIYTDCPDLNNQIGQLQLPMLEYDRMEPVTVSLPPDYLNKTLTIAQSTDPAGSETQTADTTVWPCDVTLYCGYAYESSLIAAATEVVLPAAMLFAVEIFILIAFIWNTCLGNFSLKLPVIALALFFHIINILSRASFFSKYFGILPVDPVWLSIYLSIWALLLFLTLYAERLWPLYLTGTIFYGITIFLSTAAQTGKFSDNEELYVFLLFLPQTAGFFSLLLALLGGIFLSRSGSRFFRHMNRAFLGLLSAYAIFIGGSAFFKYDYAADVWNRLKSSFSLGTPGFSLTLTWFFTLTAALIAVILELITQITQYFTENTILSLKNTLALESYENLRHQSEETMMLRHDMMKHFTLLQSMLRETPEKVPGYLDELLGEADSIQSVVSSQNQILNILINGKLHMAASKGIRTEINRCSAPAELPLTDTELCCLFVNILDNAINGALESSEEDRYIKLDFHCKNQKFIFSCENSYIGKSRSKKIPTQMHGYGLKIIRRIMSRWGENMILTEQGKTVYRLTVVIPL